MTPATYAELVGTNSVSALSSRGPFPAAHPRETSPLLVIPSEVEGPPRRSESPHSTPLRTKNHPSPPCHSDEGRIPSPQRVSPANPALSHEPPKYTHASSSTTTTIL